MVIVMVVIKECQAVQMKLHVTMILKLQMMMVVVNMLRVLVIVMVAR